MRIYRNAACFKFGVIYYLSAALVFSLLLLWPGARSVHAAGTVTTCDEASFLTALSGGGNVTFGCSGTITLNTAPATGIVIASNTTIDATGQNVIISGNGNHRIFWVNNNIQFSITNLTLRDSLPPEINPDEDGPGGAIEADETATVTVNNSTFLNNTGGYGGAIDVYEGTLNVTNSIFNGNKSTYYGGGAISAGRVNVTIENSNFLNNTSTGTGNPSGGAISYAGGNSGPVMQITDVEFSDNEAADNGGAISTNGKVTITTSSFNRNNSKGENYVNGGAISNSNYLLTVIDSIFNGNYTSASTSSGGAISNYTGDLVVKNTTFVDNSSGSQGGAIESGGGNVDVSNSTFTDNSSPQGGAIFVASSDTTIINATFSGNSVQYPTSGGAVASQGNTITISNSILANSVGGGNCQADKTYTDGGNNLEYPGTSCKFSTNAVSSDPKLMPLAYNGGPTPTMALPYNSPAVDAGSNIICAADPINNKDQRGVNRPYDANQDSNSVCDIGAYENNVQPPTMTLTFVPPTIGAGGVSTLEFTVHNPNPDQTLTALSFTNTLPDQIKVAANPAVVSTCQNSVVSANPGGAIIPVSGITLPANQNCSIHINVTSQVIGKWTNTNYHAFTAETGLHSVVASADLNVINAPSVTKSFAPATVKVNEGSVLNFVVTAPPSGNFNDIAFNDTLPAGIRIAQVPELTGNCIGSGITTPPGGSQISATHIDLLAGQSCGFSVKVVGVTPGVWVNITGPISSTETGVTGTTSNSATLIVQGNQPPNNVTADIIPQLRVTPDRVVANDAENLVTYEFKVKNVGLGAASGVKIEFPLDPRLTLGYTTFPNPLVWVTGVTTQTVTVALPDLQPNEVVTGSLTFRPNPAEVPAPDSQLATRYRVRYNDPDGSNKQQQSNSVAFVFGPAGSNQDVSGGQIQLMAPGTTTATVGEKPEFKASFFIPGEIVSAWYTRADGTSVLIVEGRADNNGEFSFTVDTTGLAAGPYAVSTYGQRSEVFGSSRLIVNA